MFLGASVLHQVFENGKSQIQKTQFLRRMQQAPLILCSYLCCPCLCETQREYEQHVHTAHQNKNPKHLLCCKICTTTSSATSGRVTTYNASKNLARHIKTSHQNVRFICDICSQTFTRSASVWKHKQRKHPCSQTPTSTPSSIFDNPLWSPLTSESNYDLKKCFAICDEATNINRLLLLL